QAVAQIDEEVRDDVDERDDEDRSLEGGQVLVESGLDDVAADARPGEDRLREDGAAEERRELEAERRHDRDERVPEAVLQDDRARREALRARGADVVLLERLEERAPGEARD